MKRVRARPTSCGISPEMLKRPVNVGFSGGEKKRNEILQMALLSPRLCVLDETDSGLDIDALRIVADGVNALRSPERGMLVITHYQRLLDLIVPDVVHVLSRRQDRQAPAARPGARARGARLCRVPRRGGSVRTAR
jgi:Fe-S cluster assembly ATP-binding protein